jgi:hypothetical protein
MLFFYAISFESSINEQEELGVQNGKTKKPVHCKLEQTFLFVTSAGGGGDFLFTTASRPALGPTHHLKQWVPGDSFRGDKAAGA